MKGYVCGWCITGDCEKCRETYTSPDQTVHSCACLVEGHPLKRERA